MPNGIFVSNEMHAAAHIQIFGPLLKTRWPMR